MSLSDYQCGDTLVVSCMLKVEIIVSLLLFDVFREMMYILSDDDVKIIIYDLDEEAEMEGKTFIYKYVWELKYSCGVLLKAFICSMTLIILSFNF